MKYTQEQLTDMTDKEINYAIAESLGWEITPKQFGISNQRHADSVNARDPKKNYYFPYLFTKTAGEYMPIAIENNISIDYLDGMVKAIITKSNWNREEYNANDFIASREMHPENTGRAVCEAFLLGVEK